MFSVSRQIFLFPKKYRSLVNSCAAINKNFFTFNNNDRCEKAKFLTTPEIQFDKSQNNYPIRKLSNLNHPVPLAARRTAVSKDESREFMALFPDLVREINEFSAFQTKQTKNVGKWLSKALQYNVPNGKKNRGLLTVLTYKELVDKSELTEENIRLAQYLGWCVEMLQSFLIMLDDIMDESQTRRGLPCWYKLEDIGTIAINDSIMVESAIFYTLKKHFADKPYYTDLIELFHEIIFITSIGQALDLETAKSKDISNFSMEKYRAIVSNKTSYYTFYLPFALAMHMAGFKDPEAFRQAKTILLEMGQFYQIQDDFLDCFGDPSKTGKIGTDIQDKKCSWLAVVCLQRCNETQKKIMLDCYGHSDPEKIERIKELYKELGLPNTYAIYEEESYNMIKTHIQQTSRGVPHETFIKILDKIYQRDS